MHCFINLFGTTGDVSNILPALNGFYNPKSRYTLSSESLKWALSLFGFDTFSFNHENMTTYKNKEIVYRQ